VFIVREVDERVHSIDLIFIRYLRSKLDAAVLTSFCNNLVEIGNQVFVVGGSHVLVPAEALVLELRTLLLLFIDGLRSSIYQTHVGGFEGLLVVRIASLDG